MPAIKENIKKVAVVKPGEVTQFLELDQQRPLAAVVKDLCVEWSLKGPEDYALQFSEPGKQTFITERNRVEIQNGNVLCLTFSPAKTAQEILERLQKGNAMEKHTVLKQLAELSVDNTFAQEFINKKGLHLLISQVESNALVGESLAYTLRAFVALMDHSIVSWDVLEHKFIKITSNLVTHKPSTQANTPDAATLQSALEILESIVLNSSGKYGIVDQEVTPTHLIQHLQSSNQEIQKNALALINALFLKADPAKKRKITEELQSKSIRNIILDNIIRKHKTPSDIDSEMSHQLYVLQCLLFSQLEERRNTKVEPNDQNAVREIMELRKIAFDMDQDPSTFNTGTAKRQSHAKDYKKLGFQNNINPVEDFTQIPPGVLALDNMVYFAKIHGQNYTKVVLENSCRADEHDCPFAQASIELTNMLCDILKVGEQPTDEGQMFYPMFFTQDRPFEEFYCSCIQLLNKTWKEMRAMAADFQKVLSVVREQVTRALDIQPANFDQFRARLQHLTYAEITNIWQQERRHKEEWESQAKPIQELREQITPEILELIKQQRLNHMVEGTRFTKYPKGTRKVKFWFCRLSPNHKFLHFGDCDETGAKPSIEQLLNKVAVVDIKSLLTGKDCPHTKEREKNKKMSMFSTAFSVVTHTEGEPLNFIAPSENDFWMWTDGINALLGNPMASDLTKQDMDMLLSMEIKLRLLDTEGVTIPENPPPIPKEPSNYEFAYNV